MPLEEKVDELYGLMAGISEDCYCAGWLGDLEYELWSIVLEGEPVEFGKETITKENINELKQLSKEIDGWVAWKEDQAPEDNPVYVSMVDWLIMYNGWLNQTQSQE